MKKVKKWYFFLLLVLSGCYYDSEESLYPVLSSDCDTTGVTFTGTVKPVLSGSCYGCHSNATAASFGNNIKLEDYTDVKTYVDNGSLYGSISHQQGYSPMPKGSAKLNNCKISQIKTWIDEGALNN